MVVAVNSADQRVAEADVLALHVAERRVHAGGQVQRVAARLGGVDRGGGGDEEAHHHREQDPALPAVADDRAEGEAEREGDDLVRPDLQRGRERARPLEGVQRVHAEEAAAVGAEVLDGHLEGDGPSAMVCLPPSSVFAST